MKLTVSLGKNVHVISSLFDTGAGLSVISEQAWRRIKTPLLRNYRIPTVLTATGERVKIVGRTSISFDECPDQRHIFTIVRDMQTPLIVGQDLMQTGHAQIDFVNRKISWCNRTFDFDTTLPSFSSLNEMAQIPDAHDPRLGQVLADYNHLFGPLEANPKLGSDIPYATIRTNAPPLKQKAYRLPLNKRRLVEQCIDDMLQANIIRPSSSPWSSPVVLVPKGQGQEVRFCVDFRKLNQVTQKDSHPIPHLQDIFDNLQGSTIFSTLDLRSGYHQIPVDPRDIEKTAFATHVGLFEFTRLPFGLCNAPAIFQRIMNRVLHGLTGQICFVYIDDIVIFSKTAEEHAEHLRQVLERLDEAGLKIKASKSRIGLKEVELLGYVVDSEGIRPNPKKVQAIEQIPQPQNRKELQSFLGVVNYYRQCVPRLAIICEPLYALTKKSVAYLWTEVHEAAFRKIKEILCSGQVLIYPDPQSTYILYTDASDYGVGAVLVQVRDGIERPVHYVSKSLTTEQRRWAVLEKEGYGIVWALQKLNPYLWGSKFEIRTDHKPLVNFFKNPIKNAKITRWSILLSEYACKICYCPGKQNDKADLLSRALPALAVLDVTDKGDNDIDPHNDLDPTEGPLDIISDGIDLGSLREQQQKEFAAEIEDAKENEDSEYVISGSLLYSTRMPNRTSSPHLRLLLPEQFRKQVIERSHKDVGHLGVGKTLCQVRNGYVWPGMRASIVSFIKKCATCEVHASYRHPLPMTDMPHGYYPFQLVGIDIVGPLPPSALSGSRYLLTCIDHYSGFAEAIPLKNQSADQVQQALHNFVFTKYGYPNILISDNGACFTAQVMREWFKQLGIEHRKSTVYHPQSNGRVERFHKTLKSLLAKAINNDQSDWESKLPDSLFAHRIAVSEVTGYSPFFMLYGRQPRVALTKFLSDSCQPFGNRLDNMRIALRVAKQNTALVRERNRRRLERLSREKRIDVGNYVTLEVHPKMALTSKRDPLWLVVKTAGPVLTVQHQSTGKVKCVNKSQARLADPDTNWDGLNPRPRRKPHLISVPDESVVNTHLRAEKTAVTETTASCPRDQVSNHTQPEKSLQRDSRSDQMPGSSNSDQDVNLEIDSPMIEAESSEPTQTDESRAPPLSSNEVQMQPAAAAEHNLRPRLNESNVWANRLRTSVVKRQLQDYVYDSDDDEEIDDELRKRRRLFALTRHRRH